MYNKNIELEPLKQQTTKLSMQIFISSTGVDAYIVIVIVLGNRHLQSDWEERCSNNKNVKK